MSEKKEIKDEQLKDVAGGERTVDGYHFYGHVGKYDGVAGNYYYVVDDGNGGLWFSGTLLESYEQNMGCFTIRTHKFEVAIAHHWRKGTYTCDKIEVSGDDVTLYEHCDFPPGVLH